MRNLRICLHSYLAKEINVIWAGVLACTLQHRQDQPFRRVKELELPASIPGLRTKWSPRCGLHGVPARATCPVSTPRLHRLLLPGKERESEITSVCCVCVSVLEARVPTVRLSFHRVGPRD